MYALVFEKKVIQIETKPFPVHSALQWIYITNNPEVTVGYVYDDGEFSPPVITPPRIIPDSIFQKAVKLMIKNLMLYINGGITKDQLNNRYDAIKEAIENIIE